jgi:hypothetical protein
VYLGNTLNSVLGGYAELVVHRSSAGGMQVIQPAPCHVDRCRSEGVCPHQRTLLRQSRLIAFEERSAIGYAAKDRGDELRIIGKAEAIEKLIFLAEIDVEASVKRLAVFLQVGRIMKIVQKGAVVGGIWIQQQQSCRVGVDTVGRNNV